MNDSIENKKQLIINDVVYADYLIEGDRLYLKKRVDRASEDIICYIISIVELVKFKQIAYLNIE